MIDVIYTDFERNQANPEYLHERVILTPLNKDVDRIYDDMFHKVIGCVRSFKSSDEVCVWLQQILEFPGMALHILNLKEQMPVMLLRNVNPAQGLCNGTRLLITKLGEWVVQAQIITGSLQ
ncbi:hypothetical protein V2J09_013332 [Rumex salicifolius]